jgi:hypothetical protein
MPRVSGRLRANPKAGPPEPASCTSTTTVARRRNRRPAPCPSQMRLMPVPNSRELPGFWTAVALESRCWAEAPTRPQPPQASGPGWLWERFGGRQTTGLSLAQLTQSAQAAREPATLLRQSWVTSHRNPSSVTRPRRAPPRPASSPSARSANRSTPPGPPHQSRSSPCGAETRRFHSWWPIARCGCAQRLARPALNGPDGYDTREPIDGRQARMPNDSC